MEDFSKPKVVYPETTLGAYFAFDKESLFIDKTAFMLLSSNAEYLQQSMSSKLFEFAYKRIYASVELGANGYQYNKHALLKLPIFKPIHNKMVLVDSDFYEIYHLNQEEIQLVEEYIAEVRKT